MNDIKEIGKYTLVILLSVVLLGTLLPPVESSEPTTQYNITVYWEGARSSRTLSFTATNCESEVQQDLIYLQCMDFGSGSNQWTESTVYEGIIQSYTMREVDE